MEGLQGSQRLGYEGVTDTIESLTTFYSLVPFVHAEVGPLGATCDPLREAALREGNVKRVKSRL